MYKNKQIACVIPARMSSSRFPNKPLAKIHGRELVLRVADAARKCKWFDRIIVATEDQVIKDLVDSEGYEGWITGKHYTCNHRVSEVASHLRCDYIFNLQGDEPLAVPEHIDYIVEYGVDHESDMVQPYRETLEGDTEDPDVVQMIINNGRVLYLMRIPEVVTDNVVPQLGYYFYKREVIEDYRNLDMTFVKHWKGLDTIGFCGKYNVDALLVPNCGKQQGVDRPEHIEIIEQRLMELNE
tara:strand:+ start:1361 stop:2080 length:720 start_codon:yes stop_codon:yes gene_type:complete